MIISTCSNENAKKKWLTGSLKKISDIMIVTTILGFVITSTIITSIYVHPVVVPFVSSIIALIAASNFGEARRTYKKSDKVLALSLFFAIISFSVLLIMYYSINVFLAISLCLTIVLLVGLDLKLIGRILTYDYTLGEPVIGP